MLSPPSTLLCGIDIVFLLGDASTERDHFLRPSFSVVPHGQWAHLDKVRLALTDQSAKLVEPSLCLVSLLRQGDTCAYSFWLMSSSTSRSNAALTQPLTAAIPNGTARLPLVVLSSPPVQSSSDLSRPESRPLLRTHGRQPSSQLKTSRLHDSVAFLSFFRSCHLPTLNLTLHP